MSRLALAGRQLYDGRHRDFEVPGEAGILDCQSKQVGAVFEALVWFSPAIRESRIATARNNSLGRRLLTGRTQGSRCDDRNNES